ncbi:MAG: hypothetical protein EPN57_22935 [Paraburkholderia sp.]|nr:MAG: hypothetical protein EPN57_22935 [Paraburkholderia sp.]
MTIEFDSPIPERCLLLISDADEQADDIPFSSGQLTVQRLTAAVRLLPLVEDITSRDQGPRAPGRWLYRGWCITADADEKDNTKHPGRGALSIVSSASIGNLTMRSGPDRAAA